MSSTHSEKVYLVTGVTTGIGAATVAHLAGVGARVVATGRSPDTLEAAQRSAPDNVEILDSDAGDLRAIEALGHHLETTYGTIDGAFINAGVAPFAPLEAWTEQQFDTLFDVNVKGYEDAGGGANRVTYIGVAYREIPEPGSLALMGLGALMIARRRRG